MCWEDVSVDRELLEINDQSKIMMISSAGCNALSYLLDNPKIIHSVDINPKQTALLELKLSLLKHCDYQHFADFFWDGRSENYQSIYKSVWDLLSQSARDFWDSHIHYFSPNRGGLYFEGGSGMFARFLNSIIERKSLRDIIIQMSYSDEVIERDELLKIIESELWSGYESNMWHRNAVLSLAGIPTVQRNAVGDINHFMRKVLRQIFVDQQASGNPYWGRYLKLPSLKEPTLDYLQEENFEKLRSRSQNIEFTTASFSNHLSNTQEKFTHFVLLDHMDWMIGHSTKELYKEWELIFDRAEPGARVLFRTAFDDLTFLPEFVLERCNIEQVNPNWLKINDRVGTYTGTYLGVIE